MFPSKVCFKTFSEKRKKTNCREKYAFWGVLQKTYLFLQFRRYNKRQSTTYRFCEFLKNKILRSKSFLKIKNAYFFLLKRDRISKKYYVTVWPIQFPTKWCLFQPHRLKNVGGDTFLVDKSVLFRGGNTSKHKRNYVSNINVNNNKTVDM